MATVEGAGFNRAEFEAGIRTAMKIGAPVNAADQAKFYFQTARESFTSADGRGVPFDPATTPTETTPDPVTIVNCAIEGLDENNKPTPFGLLDATRLRITLLDDEYQQVVDCAYVVVGGERYDYRRTEPPQALFDSQIHVMMFQSAGGRP